MTTLHAIADAIIEAAQVDENGELTPESIAALDALNLTLAQKVEAYHYVYAELTTKACASKELAAYYEKRAKAPKAAAERLKERLRHEMLRLKTTKVETPTCKACVEESPDSVKIKEGVFIPREWTLPEDPRPDKKKIAQTLKCGVTLPFAELVTGNTHLRFR
jgi:hypothetical protein